MNDVQVGPQQPAEEFLAARGGPFYEMQYRLQLLHDNTLESGRRALVFVTLAWMIPLVLALINGDGGAFLADHGVWARFFIAIGAFILAEQQVEHGLRQKLRQMLSASIVAQASLPVAAAAVARALRRRNLRGAEAICLGLAVVASIVALRHQYGVPETSWAVVASPSGNAIMLAGWWTIAVSLPLFWFLVLRGLWRHFVWSLLMRDIAGLELKLVSTHPDGRGGIGFIAEYPNAYMTFVFGMSCAVATAVGQNLLQETASIRNLSILMGGWLLLVLALFAFPLSAFSRPLTVLKKATIARLGAQATRYHRLAERKLLGSNVVADSPAEAEATTDTGDPTKQFETTRKLSTMLLDRRAILPVSAAALVPFSILAAQRVPFKEVLSLLKKLLLL